MIGTVMIEPIRPSVAGSSGTDGIGGTGGQGGIGAIALADRLGRWPAADGPLHRLLATRIARPPSRRG